MIHPLSGRAPTSPNDGKSAVRRRPSLWLTGAKRPELKRTAGGEISVNSSTNGRH